MERKGICVAGTLIVDRHYALDYYPSEGFLTHIAPAGMDLGGTGNMILDLAKLDATLPVKVCGMVGEDDCGREALAALAKYPSIDTADVVCEGQTSQTLVMNAANTRQRTFFHMPAANDIFDETKIHWDSIHSRIFHLEYLLLMKRVDAEDGEFGTHGARILKHAQDRGMLTSMDMVSEQSDRVRRVVLPALKYTDICCINEEEAEALTGIKVTSPETAEKALRALHGLGVSTWVVIHSPKYNYGYDVRCDEVVCVNSLKLPAGYIKGTTGAGDAFCTGILYGAHNGESLEASMKLAIACAACSLSENNGTDGMRSRAEVLALLEQYGG